MVFTHYISLNRNLKSVLGICCDICSSKWTQERLIFFAYIYPLIYKEFTIQKRQIKLEIHNPQSKISLETKFQPIILKTVDNISFSRTLHFFPILKT